MTDAIPPGRDASAHTEANRAGGASPRLVPGAPTAVLSNRGAAEGDRTSDPAHDREHLRQVIDYYQSRESRLGYAAFLGGTKHFGYYRPGDPSWRLRPALRRMEDLLAQTLDLPTGSLVLDAGCGVGDVACRLAGVHGLRVTGIDILNANLESARRRARRRRLSDRLSFQQMDYTALAFLDDTFDGAYTFETLVHSDRIEDVLAGLHRVLKPGGRVVHVEYARKPEAECTPVESTVLREINDAAAMPGWQRLDYGLLPRLLGDAGFVDVQAVDLTERMMPMLKVFHHAAWGPYTALRRLGQSPPRAVNAMSAVEFYRHPDCWRYEVISAVKPRQTQALTGVDSRRP